MKKEVFQELQAVLLTVSGITDVRIWNTATPEDQDILGKLPIVFVEFTNIAYNPGPDNMQECEQPVFNLHVLFKAIDQKDTAIFDISQDIFKAMQRAGYTRTRETPTFGGTEVIDWKIEFIGPRFVDEYARITMITITRPPVTVEIPNP